MSIPITGIFAPSGGAGAFKLVDIIDVDMTNATKAYTGTGGTLLTADDADDYTYFNFNMSASAAQTAVGVTTQAGKKIILVGLSDTYYPTFDASTTNLQMTGPAVELKLDCVMELIWLEGSGKWLQGFTLVQ